MKKANTILGWQTYGKTNAHIDFFEGPQGNMQLSLNAHYSARKSYCAKI